MKRGSLNLSVNAIVVFVLAFALLSVGLGFTYMFRERGEAGLASLLNFEDLKEPPSSDKPLTIDREVNIRRGSSLQLDIGYYNSDSGPHNAVQLLIEQCFTETGTETSTKPTIASVPQQVDASEGVGFRVIMKADDMPGGQTYICKLKAEDSTDGKLEEKQFYLTVIS